MARRIFIAADLDRQTQEMIHAHASSMFQDMDGVRITPACNLHITLKFLGSTGDEKIQAIKKITGGSLQGTSSFSYNLKRCAGAFPHPERARIIFIGIEEGKKKLQKIFYCLEEALSVTGIKRQEREFMPHITIARIRRPFDTGRMISAPIPSFKIKPGMGSVSLYESILGSQGPRYINMARFVLK